MSTSPIPPRSILELAQDEMIMKNRIATALREAPKTIPELARCLGYPAHEITVWLFGLRRYGEVEAKGRPDIDGYFKYEWVDKAEG
jgi:predicted Rossmann fold nucleotide-binding protein DprA/Smf involved in DNA uptake